MIDAEVALVGVANIKYKTPVYAGSRLVAKAVVATDQAKESYRMGVYLLQAEGSIQREIYTCVD